MKLINKVYDHLKKDGLINTLKLYSESFRSVLTKKAVIIFKSVFMKLPVREAVFFECESDMDDNPRAFYEYLLGINWNKNHW